MAETTASVQKDNEVPRNGINPEDPTMALLTYGRVGAAGRPELDGDAWAFCFPKWDNERKFITDWLTANAPTATVELGVSDTPPDDEDSGTNYVAWLRFPNAALASAYVEMVGKERRAWEELHALVKPGDTWCHACGGPAVEGSVSHEFQVRHILIRHVYPGHTCPRCGDAGDVLIRANDPYAWRLGDFVSAARAAFGIPKGETHRPDRATATVTLETDENTTDAEFATRLGEAVGDTDTTVRVLGVSFDVVAEKIGAADHTDWVVHGPQDESVVYVSGEGDVLAGVRAAGLEAEPHLRRI